MEKFGSGMEKSRVRDKHPGSATLETQRSRGAGGENRKLEESHQQQHMPTS
jgi:hypothetical protein